MGWTAIPNYANSKHDAGKGYFTESSCGTLQLVHWRHINIVTQIYHSADSQIASYILLWNSPDYSANRQLLSLMLSFANCIDHRYNTISQLWHFEVIMIQFIQSAEVMYNQG